MNEHIDGIICNEDDVVVCALIADKLNIPMFYRRNKTKGWGKRKSIEGDLSELKKCKKLYNIEPNNPKR